MSPKSYLWLAVTPDQYELPLAVADTAEQLGRMFGVSRECVISSVRIKSSGAITGRKFVKVRTEE